MLWTVFQEKVILVPNFCVNKPVSGICTSYSVVMPKHSPVMVYL